MAQYTAENIRNIALAGHGSAGKTSLAEALLFKAGATDRLGKVLDANTVCDFDPEEIKRKVSVSLAVAHLSWKDKKINLIDTPGLFDFAAGMYEGVRAANNVLIALSGKSGVSVGTEKAYRMAKNAKKPAMFCVTKLDRDNADFYKVLEQLKTVFGPSVCPVVVPVYESRDVVGYINLIEMKAYAYDSKGEAKEYLKERIINYLTSFGGECICEGEYPGWDFARESKLRDTVLELGREILGRELKVAAFHAGLECGVFAGKIQGLDCVSIGPEINYIHTTEEELNIASAERCYRLVRAVIEKM